MKKISLFALLVLAGLLFAAPALRAQEAEETEAQKKAKALKMIEDDDQLGNFLGSLDPEALAAYISAVVESGDAALIDRVSNALNNLGTDIATAIAGGNSQTPAPETPATDNADAAASSIAETFGDAGDMLDGDDFNNTNPVVTTAAAGDEEEEDWPIPPGPIPPISRSESRY